MVRGHRTRREHRGHRVWVHVGPPRTWHASDDSSFCAALSACSSESRESDATSPNNARGSRPCVSCTVLQARLAKRYLALPCVRRRERSCQREVLSGTETASTSAHLAKYLAATAKASVVPHV